MLSLQRVLEVKRLLDEGRLSRRAIAQATGVSRGSVNAIANGCRGVHGAGTEPGLPAADPVRCPGCGGKVYPPCVLCRARRCCAWPPAAGRGVAA